MPIKRVPFGILCLTVLGFSQPASAQPSTAWLYAFREPPPTTFIPWSMGISDLVSSPIAAIFGHLPPAGAIGEIAVTQAIISVGDQVPLPSYADGTSAQEQDVFWTAQLWHAEFPGASGVMRYRNGDHVLANFDGRRFISGEAQINSGGEVPPLTTDFQVLVNVFAVRTGVTPARRQTMGSLKARYR